MRISANMATHKARRNVLPMALRSIAPQVDIVRVYCNDYDPDNALKDEFGNVQFFIGSNYTDRAKFFWVWDEEYYFTIDDDIGYPEWYVERTLTRLKENPKTIFTYHGRKLQGKGLNYYHGHKQYHFLREVKQDAVIDVPGTGCSAFNTAHIEPDIINYSEDCMSDLLLGLEAAKKGWPIVCLAHDMHDLMTLLHPRKASIYNEYSGNCERQSELADDIIKISPDQLPA